MNLALLNPKVWFELACVAVVAGLLWYAYHWAYMNGFKAEEAEFNAYKVQVVASALAAQKAADSDKSAFQTSLENLTDAYIKEKSAHVATATSAANSLRDLQTALAAARSASASNPATPGSTDGTAGSISELFGTCATTLVKLAEEADTLEERVVGLQAYATYIQKTYGVKP